MAPRKKQFPIAEVVTGIIMLIIVFTFGLPRYFNWLQESKIGVATSRMFEDLQVAKRTAIKNRHRVIVTFNAAASGYTVHEDVNGNGVLDSGEPTRKAILGNGIQFGTNSKLNVMDIWGHEILEENPIALIGGGNRIVFNTQGQASTSGAIYLVPAEEAGIRNDYLRAVRIIRTTGSIKVLRYAPNASPPWK